jgi:hypothetical protein
VTPATAPGRFRLAWPATAVLLGGLLLALAIAAVPLSRLAHQSLNASNGSVPVWISAIYGGLLALPVSMAVAVFKYRLLDIDRILSRTLAYAIVTGLLIGVYAGLVLLATRVLTVHTPIAVAAATLAAAALFTPLCRRVQRIVDRRFNRARYDADRTMAAFAARLQDAVDLDTVQGDLLTTVHRALEPAHASVWMPGAGP